ncbi:hypothetical protein Tsubulata_004151 [Turnera subulata]|uniref:Uncharacterized protein n=1 Tax=Turnera subulata TaxID=218843 RepID=A0A9Q0F090_9ROSI|nr:hypothetical protein Tsubulata_004151 [Turnera subulata]
MGCFLACFGSSKDRRRRKQRHRKVQPRRQRNEGFDPVQSTVSSVQEELEKPIPEPASDIRDNKPEENLSLSARKKVTFDSNVRTYEHVPVEESIDFSAEKEDGGIAKKKEEEGDVAKPRQSHSSSEGSSITSSEGSFPPNHRYQNCRESDDELDYEESDVDELDDDDDDDDDDDGELDYGDIDEDDGIVQSRSRISTARVVTEQIGTCAVPGEGPDSGSGKPNQYARDRSAYVHPVLNPVENLSQWRAVKSKGTPAMKQRKENLASSQETPGFSFSSEPTFKTLSSSSRAKPDWPRKSGQEIAVDASLSTWLGSSECTTINKTTAIGFDAITPEKAMSVGSNSPRSFDDRPILGALTMEEIKQFSASNSPRKSPNRSPDEMPIIGSVGTYWNHSSSAKDSGSVSSYKGIPNTTSKYREDKIVNWHSTPFETRLERALTGGAIGTHSAHTSNVC